MKCARFSILLLCLWLYMPSHTLADSHYLPVDGVTVHYKTMGKGPDTVFFAHGFSCDTTVWRMQYPALLDYRIITMDLPGHGMSGSPRVAYTQKRFAHAIKAVMDAEHADKILLVTHSMGHQIARVFIDAYPQRIAGLCIVDGAYFRNPADPLARAKLQKNLWNFVAITSTDETMDQFLAGMRAETSSEAVAREFSKLMLSTPVHVRISTMRDFCTLTNWGNHAQDVPVLSVYAATQDMPADNEPYLRTLFPNLEYHQWSGVGHFLMMERPREFNALLVRFAQKINAQD